MPAVWPPAATAVVLAGNVISVSVVQSWPGATGCNTRLRALFALPINVPGSVQIRSRPELPASRLHVVRLWGSGHGDVALAGHRTENGAVNDGESNSSLEGDDVWA